MRPAVSLRWRTIAAPFLFLALLAAPAAAESFVPPALVPNRTALEAIVPGGTVDILGSYAVVVPAPARPTPALDGRYGWRFGRAAFVYELRADKPAGFARRVTVHYNRDDAPIARRTARLVARLLRLHHERFERPATFPRSSPEADLWLARETPAGQWPQPGGETRDNQVYVFDTGAARTAIEWTRTLAHEWGHLTLPAARAFWEPESDASGFLGERLYLKWLREERQAGTGPASDDGTDAASLDLYYQRQIAPLIARFQALGPEADLLNHADGRAMDLYVGAALAIDDSLGSALLGRGLFTVLDVHPRALLTALGEQAGRSATLAVRLPAWVPLRRATYEITGRRPGALLFANHPPLSLLPNGVTRLQVRFPGWKWIRAASGGVTAITLRPTGPPSASKPPKATRS